MLAWLAIMGLLDTPLCPQNSDEIIQNTADHVRI